MTARLRELATAIQLRSGIHLSDAQLGSAKAALRRMDPALTPARLLDDADSTRRAAMLDRLVDEVTVNETFFVRNREELDRIDWLGLLAAAHAAGRPRVRVWSAACSSGEEAYTLALLAAERLGASVAALVEVLGTDISPTILDRARSGVYGKRSTRLLSPEQRRRWFEPDAAGLRVGAALRALVRFERHNLAGGPSPAVDGNHDLIVCRNVLIYFDSATAKRVVAELHHKVTPGGRLILGAADRLGIPRVGRPEAARPAPVRRQPRPRPTPALEARPVAAIATVPSAGTAALEAFGAGIRALGQGEAERAVELLRRSLYLDPDLTVAALQLGRAHEASGDRPAARRAYGLALRQADSHAPSMRLHDRVGAADVAAACRARLLALSGA